MKKILFIALLFHGCYCAAQTFTYTYDDAGNITGRTYCSGCLRLANPNPPKDSTQNDIATKYGISVYPNPTSQEINVFIAALTNGQSAAVYLFDDQGKCIITKKQSSGNEAIELSGLSSGIYQLKVVINDEQVSYRIIKL